jgi:hypothetical protein
MCTPTLLFRVAGAFVMLSVALGWFVHPGFFAFTAFVGFNLFQTSFTGFCPLERILGRVGAFGCTPRTPTAAARKAA